MSDGRIDEAEELLRRLASVSARVDPVPFDVVEAAVACFAGRSPEAEPAGSQAPAGPGGRPLRPG